LLTLDLGAGIIHSNMTDSYQKALDDARKELADLPKQRLIVVEFFNQREAQLKKIIEGLEPICDTVGQLLDNPTIFDLIADDYEPGLQQAVEAVIYANSPNPMEPTQVRDALERAGVNTKTYSNPMATIHRALKRLHDSPESPVHYQEVNGKKLYGWAPRPGFKERFLRGSKQSAAERLGLVPKVPGAQTSSVNQLLNELVEGRRKQQTSVQKAIEEAGKSRKS